MSGPRLSREAIAKQVAKYLPDGAYVNLGFGIPTLVSQFTPEGRTVIYHSENGLLNYGPLASPGQEDIYLVNAGLEFLLPVPGMAFFHAPDAFAMIRGGHIDVVILGAFQVSERGDFANWIRPGRPVGNIGGAMDLVAGAKRVFVAMAHTDPQGEPKVLRQCSFPLTGSRCVSLIVTDVAVIEVTPSGLLLREVAPGWTSQKVQDITEPRLALASNLREMEL